MRTIVSLEFYCLNTEAMQYAVDEIAKIMQGNQLNEWKVTIKPESSEANSK